MSDTANEMWKRIVTETSAEVSRLGTQGAMELSSAIFNGDAFVPYGPGQYTPDGHGVHGPEQEHSAEHQQEMSIER